MAIHMVPRITAAAGVGLPDLMPFPRSSHALAASNCKTGLQLDVKVFLFSTEIPNFTFSVGFHVYLKPKFRKRVMFVCDGLNWNHI